MNDMKRWMVPVMLAAAAVACQPTAVRDGLWGDAPVPVGTVFVLHRDIVIPPRSARTFIQFGEVVPAVAQYQPLCEFRVRGVSDEPRKVHAGRFEIISVSREERDTVDSGARRLAAVGVAIGMGGGDQGDLIEYWIMRLRSQAQPEALWLACAAGFDIPARTRTPTLAEMRATLGPVATLELPDGQ